MSIFLPLDPDPDRESGSRDPIESGSNPDPDPQLCFLCSLREKKVQFLKVITYYVIYLCT